MWKSDIQIIIYILDQPVYESGESVAKTLGQDGERLMGINSTFTK